LHQLERVAQQLERESSAKSEAFGLLISAEYVSSRQGLLGLIMVVSLFSCL
jgi:hypothetical protein